MKTFHPFTLRLLLLCYFGIFSPVFTLYSNYVYRYTTEQSLSDNTVYSILQDKLGLVWIATEEGLNKFDGRDFTHFAVGKGRYALTHNRAQTLLLAPDGNVWIGTSDGLNIYDYATDSIIRVDTTSGPLRLLYSDITYLTSNPSKTITWIGTYGDGVHYFEWKTQKFRKLQLPSVQGIIMPDNVVSLLEDDNQRLWIGTRHNGLYCYNIQKRTLRYYTLPESGRFIRAIYQDSFRRIWIGASDGCYVYNETSDKPEKVRYPEVLSNNSVGAITEDSQGRIWIGSELNGAGDNVVHFSVRSFSLNQFFDYQSLSYGSSSGKLNCPSINALHADRDNNMWIGTAWGGLNMVRGIPPKFKLFKHDSDSEASLPNSPVTALFAKNNEVFIATMGTDDTGAGVLDLSSGTFRGLTADNRLKNYVYQTILQDHEGNLWLGTYNKGLIKTDKNGRILRHFNSNKQGIDFLPENDVRALYQSDFNQRIWIATSSGFDYFDFSTQKIVHVPIFSKRIGVRCVREDSDGKIWLGTYGDGIMNYDPLTATLISNPQGFNPGIINDIFIHNDSIWVATQSQGLLLYDKKTGAHEFFNDPSKGLVNVKSIIRDKAGQMWFSTSKGISSLNPATHDIKTYTTQDGVQGGEFTDRSAAATSGGHLVFAGFAGVNVFHPQDVIKNDRCPSVVFTRLQVFNDVVYPVVGKRSNRILKKNISLADEIILKHNQSVFTIDFAAINYDATQKIQYAYLLRGSDSKWNDLGNRNSVTFRNLKPGKYWLKVRASSPDAIWSDENIISISIRILPPVWKTVWAYLVYFLIILVLLYFAWQYATIRIRANNRLKIERARREQEEMLHQEKIQFFTNISHEFRTPLTLIISPLEKMHQEESDKNRKLHFHLMLKNARRLLSMVNQLLDFRKAERGQMKLKVQQVELISVFTDIFSTFDELRREKNIQFEFIHEAPESEAWIDVDVLTKSLFNLLSNAYKFCPEGAEISVTLSEFLNEKSHRWIRVVVADNGKGIQADDIPLIFNRFYQGKDQKTSNKGSGIGLHLTRSLIELHHGIITVESLPGVRTAFTFELPVDRNAFDQEEVMIDFESSSQESQGVITESADDNYPAPKSGHPHRKKILIVEDNEDIRHYIRSILGEAYRIEEAENGQVALEMVGRDDYDLIISDLMMPEMDGMEMCKQLKGSIETSHIPIILLTAKSEIESRIQGLDIGAESYITKPFHPKHLLVRVAKLIELRELLKGRYSKKISLGDISDTKATSPDELFMQKAIRIILEKMIDTEFNGDMLAADMGVSRMGLHRKIKAMTGQSTGEFIRNIRLKKAAELLQLPGRNISEVCYDVGFSSPSYFTTCFAEVYKVTPSEYMKQHRDEV
jgi:signal transduction histidine kinase/ligand-binding sensor domain-containing protein/AraC-like DNA-binding protein/ActR/RegA family two-component response regulator